MDNNITEFLIELEALSRKHKLRIGGCGCCGSPFIEPLKDTALVAAAGYTYEDNLAWVSPGPDGVWLYSTPRPARPEGEAKA